jgi:hypothetical protein
MRPSISRRCRTARRTAFALLSALLFSLATASAHDIPNDVTIQAFLKPSGDKLYLLVRVPLNAIRDVDFPSRKEGFLDLDRTAPMLPDAARLWLSDFIGLYENDTLLPKPRVLATRLSLPSDKSFTTWEEARAHLDAPGLNTDVLWDQLLFDTLFEYPIHSDRSNFSINPGGLNRLGLHVVTILQFVPPASPIRAFEFVDTDPGLVRLDPRWYQAAARFVDLGFHHILDGTDHLLFLFCLVIPFRRFRGLIPVVTAFTVAHSITLIASAYDLAPNVSWFPPLIETLIAVSIVYMALENIVGGATVKRRWMVAFGFGLVHGFGFSFTLRQTLQLAGSHMLTSLLSFNVGVELGQLLVLALLIPALELLFRYVVAERMGTIILSALVAHTAWHWMTERYEVFRRYRIEWPVFDAALWADVLKWLMLIVIAGGVVWFVATVVRQRSVQRDAAAIR